MLPHSVRVRDSKDTGQPAVPVTPAAWAAFVGFAAQWARGDPLWWEWRGHDVVDRERHRTGVLEAVHVGTATDRPAFVTVAAGLPTRTLTPG